MILILTHRDDLGRDRVERRLRELGEDVTRFDPGDLPMRAACSLRFTRATGWQRTIERVDAPSIDVGRISAVWLRRPGARQLPAQLDDPAMRRYVGDEWSALAGDLFSGMDCFWLPAAPAIVRETMRKCRPLMLAHELGFRIPDTAFTSRPQDLFDLHRAHGGNIITKQASASAFPNAFENRLLRYTERVSARDLGYARRLRTSPVLVQENVAKRLEIRVTVVGEHVFAAEIDSQASHRTRQDWRRYDHSNTPLRVHVLPAPVERRCVEITRRLGLSFGAMDLILTPDDEYLFLEINPAGEFGWIEDATRMPISEAIADLLRAGAMP
jgi:hypothetical protein